ncbi:MAG: nitrous oxide reductase family maturation protein NosD [Alphaproteobacteria bacterium]|nr:nitrous oxide reductase family maturation protein NosD [Alphaproteobacteria bacterium]
MRIIPILLAILLKASMALAATLNVEPGGLAGALKMAQAGDILRLKPGAYKGPINIQIPLTLEGGGKASIKGNNTGSVISVSAADVTIRGLTVTGSGSEKKDAGIDLSAKALRALVENNTIIGNLIGVNVQGAKDAIVQGNVIEGRQDARMNARGNGVYVWNAPGAKVLGNDIRWGRDGIFVNASMRNEFIGNRFRDLRFAVHYMYAHDSVVADNISIGNHLGYAVMFSKNVTIRGNISRDDRNYGIMLNYTNNSRITGNLIQRTADRCVFIYNAHKNLLTGNWFEGCETGIHFTAGSERNQITGNAFIGNRTQVKYVGTKWVDWSVDGRGNYWSDHASFDLDGNGIADTVFRPNDAMDRVLWTQPAAKLLIGSPAVQLIRWSQSAFPALLPGGVIDRFPLMQPVMPEIQPWGKRQ